MKLSYILTAAIILATSVPVLSAQNSVENPDTLMIVQNPDRVIVREDSHQFTVEAVTNSADGEEQIETFVLEYPKNSVVKSSQRFVLPFGERHNNGLVISALGGLHFGFDGVAGHDRIATEMGKSFEIGISNVLAVRYAFNPNNDFGVGVGVNWRNYRMTGTQTCMTVNDGYLVQVPYDQDIEGKYSRIKVFSVGFPITYSHQFPFRAIGKANFSVRVGVILNWNSHASLATRWIDEQGRRATYTTDHIGHRKFTVDGYIECGIAPATSIYFKCSPQTLFDKGRGPQFHTFSTGISFFW